MYQAEKIVGTRMKNLGAGNSRMEYCVKWAGYDSKQNTYEPIEHLAGCEDMIAAYFEEKKQQDAEAAAAIEEKKRQKQEEERQLQKAAADAAAAARVAAAGDAPAEAPAPDGAGQAVTQQPGPAKKSRRSAKCWEAFDETGAPKGKACCTLPHPKRLGQICGEPISIGYGPTNLWNHLEYVHPADFIRLKGPSAPLPKIATTALAVPESKRDELHKAHARWIVKRKRPFSIVEDEEYRDVWRRAMNGAYIPPDHNTLRGHVLLLSKDGQQRLVDVNTALRATGIKPGAAGDIWSDRGVSLLGMCEYYMSDDWEIVELVRAYPTASLPSPSRPPSLPPSRPLALSPSRPPVLSPSQSPSPCALPPSTHPISRWDGGSVAR